MEKKLYYRIDNGDTSVICDWNALEDILKAEASNYNEDSNKQDEPQWIIDLVFLTKDEYKDLPEAY